MNGLRKIWMMAAGLWCMMTASAQTADSTAWRNVFTDPQLTGITGRFFDPLKMAEVRGLMFDV